jgi:hypothetical protein
MFTQNNKTLNNMEAGVIIFIIAIIIDIYIAYEINKIK